MKRLPWSLVLLIAVLFVAGANSETRELYDAFITASHPNATCVHKNDTDFGDTACGEFLTYDWIYTVPGRYKGKTQEEWRFFVKATLVSIANQNCRVFSARFTCPIFYRRCQEVVSPNAADPENPTPDEIAVVGSYPCSDMCYAHFEPCESSVPPPDRDEFFACNPPNPFFFNSTDVVVFPDGPEVLLNVESPNGDTWVFEDTCYGDSRDISYIPPYNCPDNMHRTGGGTCAFNCPEPLLDNDEFDTITDMMSGISWISLVLMAFLVITYMLDPSKRKFPNHLPMFFFISVMCFSFAFCLASVLPDGTHDMLCENEEDPNYFGDGACTVQGILVVYFFIAAVFWWLVICVNIFLMLIFAARSIDYKRTTNRNILMASYHIFAWVIPLIPLIISLAAHRLGANGSDLWCTIHSSDEDNALKFVIGKGDGVETEGETANVWNFVLFWMPVIACVAIGVILILVVIIFQLRQETGIKGFWTFIKGQWRIFAFLALYIWVCVFLFAFQLDFLNRRNDQYEEYEEYIQCLFRKTATENFWVRLMGFSAVPAANAVYCDLSSEINYPLWVLAAFNFAGQGIFVFLIFGTSRRIYLVWWKLFTCSSSPFSTTGSSSSSARSMDNMESTASGKSQPKSGKVTRVQGKKLTTLKYEDSDS
ncbi:Frizzled-10 [Balamuthia mandrillaris]